MLHVLRLFTRPKQETGSDRDENHFERKSWNPYTSLLKHQIWTDQTESALFWKFKNLKKKKKKKSCNLPKSWRFSSLAAQHGLLSLLVLYKFPTLKLCHGNQMKWPLVIKHINWVDNHQKIITAKYGSHHSLVIEEMQFNHFPIISLWVLSTAMATKPRSRSPEF